jgi:hypothetical protein
MNCGLNSRQQGAECRVEIPVFRDEKCDDLAGRGEIA